MHVLHQTAQLPCVVCCVSLCTSLCNSLCNSLSNSLSNSLCNSLCNKLSSTHTCRSAGTWFWSILMTHAFMKALYASGEQHSPTCWPAVMPQPADVSRYNQRRPVGGFCMACRHTQHAPAILHCYNVQFSSACMQDLSSRPAHCGKLAV